MQKYNLVVLMTLSVVAITAQDACAHAIVGDRVFPATLAVDDPGVSDEMNLPLVSRFKEPGEEGEKARWGTETSVELNKRITENLGLAVEAAWVDEGHVAGWDNIGVGTKYVFYKNAPHEAMLSLGLDWDIGGSGAKKIGAERFSTLTPAVFFGKGFGDLPDNISLLKPLALTGSLGYAVPTDNFAVSFDGEIVRTRNPRVLEWGMTMQYSLPYLQQHVKDVGLPKLLGMAIPVVEFALETPTNGEDAGRTTGTINPGIIFTGEIIQLGLEAMIPVNDDSGNNVGARAQVHVYFDDLFPKTLGRPLW
ncbi:MAG: hypothetical protein IPP74_08205 [Alphaproteobacteria bacterium]|nr:hypothetical protein [Alphaproteobacteria bacterium]